MTPDDLAAAPADCERARAVAHDFWCTPVEETVGVLLRLAAHCERLLEEVGRLKREAALFAGVPVVDGPKPVDADALGREGE